MINKVLQAVEFKGNCSKCPILKWEGHKPDIKINN